jgi:hypothetical protein
MPLAAGIVVSWAAVNRGNDQQQRKKRIGGKGVFLPDQAKRGRWAIRHNSGGSSTQESWRIEGDLEVYFLGAVWYGRSGVTRISVSW